VSDQDEYLLIGHKIYDVERFAEVNYIRQQITPPVYGDFSNRFYGLDPSFNPDLYKIMYPDAYLFTDEHVSWTILQGEITLTIA
jgi:hypothetical protein